MTLNGKKISVPVSKGYAQINRKWAPGDVVTLTIPMPIEKLEANPNVLQSRGKVALRRGPLIYCLEQPDNKTDLDRIALPLSANLAARFEPTLLGGLVLDRAATLFAQVRDRFARMDKSGMPQQRMLAHEASLVGKTTLSAVPFPLFGSEPSQGFSGNPRRCLVL